MPTGTREWANQTKYHGPQSARRRTPDHYRDEDQDRQGNRRTDNQAANEKRAAFIKSMRRNYQESFEKRYADMRPDMDREDAMDEARDHFDTLINALNRWAIHQTAYGEFDEEERQEHVNAFHQEITPLLQSLGPLAARGDTLLWSNFDIGRFASERASIREAAGATRAAEPLSATPFGQLLDQILLTTDPNASEHGLLWAHQLQIWNAASLEFAKNAEGDVHIFLPEMISPFSVFWNVELYEIRKRAAATGREQDIWLHRLTPRALKDLTNLATRLKNIDQALAKTRDSNHAASLREEREDVIEEKIEVMSRPEAWITVEIMEADIAVPTYQKEAHRGVIKGKTLLKYLRIWQRKQTEGPTPNTENPRSRREPPKPTSRCSPTPSTALPKPARPTSRRNLCQK